MDKQEKQLLESLKHNKYVLQMKRFKQHGFVNTYQHSCNVTHVALRLASLFHIKKKKRQNIIVGAMLHDFYLYDYHNGRVTKYGLHALSHPLVAANNAEKTFHITSRQKDIIKTHMFPSTIVFIPKTIEGWIVNLSDKYCAVCEIIYGILYQKAWEVKA